MTETQVAQAAPPRFRFGGWDAVNAVALIALAVTISVLGVVRAPSFSIFDEATHADYVWQLAHGRIPAAGSELAPEVRQEWSCRGQDTFADSLPECGSDAPAGAYPGAGQNYNFPHPPLYYGITALVVQAVELVGVDASFVDVARLTGGGWLAAALVVLYLLLRTWSLPRSMALAAGVLVAAVPSVAHAATIVTNDAAAALSGVLALWVLTRIALRDKLGWLLPTLLTLAVAATKLMTAIAMLAVAAVAAGLAVRAWHGGRRRDGWRLVATSAGMVGAVGVVFLAWRVFQAGRGDPDYVSPIGGISTDPVVGAPFDEWVPTLFSAFGIASDFYLQFSVGGAAAIALARLLSVVFTATPFMGLAAFDARDPRRLPAWAALVGVVSVPLVVQLQTYVAGLEYFPNVTGRYGLSLVPLTVAALAITAEAKGWRWAFGILSGGAIGTLLLSFAGVV